MPPGHLLWWGAIFVPRLSVPVIVLGAVGSQFGGRDRTGDQRCVYLSRLRGLGVGRHESRFDAWVAAPVRRRWLTWWRYTRRWESVCTLARPDRATWASAASCRRCASLVQIGAAHRRPGPARGHRPIRGRLAQARRRAGRRLARRPARRPRHRTGGTAGRPSCPATSSRNPSHCPCRDTRAPRWAWRACGWG